MWEELYWGKWCGIIESVVMRFLGRGILSPFLINIREFVHHIDYKVTDNL